MAADDGSTEAEPPAKNKFPVQMADDFARREHTFVERSPVPSRLSALKAAPWSSPADNHLVSHHHHREYVPEERVNKHLDVNMRDLDGYARHDTLALPHLTSEFVRHEDEPANEIPANLRTESKEVRASTAPLSHPTAPAEVPNSRFFQRDALMPIPFLFQEPEARVSPSPPVVVERPPCSPQLASISSISASSSGEQTSVVGTFESRANTPIVLPDPHLAPVDLELAEPQVPQQVGISNTVTHPLVVEPPNDTPDAPASIAASRAEMPSLIPDPYLAPPNAERGIPTIPQEIDPSTSPSASMIAQPSEEVPESAARTFSSRASPDSESMAEDQVIAEESPSATSVVGVGPPTTPTPGDLEVDKEEPIAFRLRHHHGLLDQTTNLSPARLQRQPRSRARHSRSPTPAAPVTRSHCSYRKLWIEDGDVGAMILVPQCTIADAERLNEDYWSDCGEPTAEEEHRAKPYALGKDQQLLNPSLATKLHRIVGKTIFYEGHCFVSTVFGVGAFASDELASHGIPNGEWMGRLPEPELSGDDEEIKIDVQVTPAASTTQRTRRTKTRAASVTPEVSSVVTRSQRRSSARSTSRATTNADDDEVREQTPTPLVRNASVGVSEEFRPHRRFRTSSAKKAEANSNTASETEREETPMPTASANKRKSRHSATLTSGASNIRTEPGIDDGDSVTSAIEIAPRPPASSKRKTRRSTAAQMEDHFSEKQGVGEGSDASPTPIPAPVSLDKRNVRSSVPQETHVGSEEHQQTPLETKRQATQPASPPSHSTRKRKYRLSAADVKNEALRREIEMTETDEDDEEISMTPASQTIRETRSMKRRAVASPSAPDVPVAEASSSEEKGEV